MGTILGKGFAQAFSEINIKKNVRKKFVELHHAGLLMIK